MKVRITTTVLLLFAYTVVSGCALLLPESRLNVSEKNAWIMYNERRDDLGPPRLDMEEFIYAKGKEEFVSHMTWLVGTKYQPEALYSLGWFGDRRHARVVAEALSDDDPEVRRIATASFSRIVHKDFTNSDDAIEWWSKRRSEFPNASPREDDSKKQKQPIREPKK